jgi:hypothetical protein
MSSNDKKPINIDKDEIMSGVGVRFDDTIYTEGDAPPPPPRKVRISESSSVDLPNRDRPGHDPNKSGILKRRTNTITTADAPRIILSDEGLKAGRVSPFVNFPLFLSMTLRSVGIIFGDM